MTGVALAARGLSKKFPTSLRRSMGYGLADLSELRTDGEPFRVAFYRGVARSDGQLVVGRYHFDSACQPVWTFDDAVFTATATSGDEITAGVITAGGPAGRSPVAEKVVPSSVDLR